MNIAQCAPKVKPCPWGDFEVALNQSIRFRHAGPLLRHLALRPEDRESAVLVLEEIGESNSVGSRRDLLVLVDEVRHEKAIRVSANSRLLRSQG